MDSFFQPVVYSALALLAAIVLEHWLPIKRAYHPFQLLAALCQRLAKKVNHPTRPTSQQTIAGILAFVLLFLPSFLILLGLYWIALYPNILDVLVLYICLSWQPLKKQALSIEQLCQTNQKAAARDAAQEWLCRECGSLSVLGLRKAMTETLMLRFTPHYLGVLFWFVLSGGLGTFTYRFVVLCSQQWNAKLPHYRHFSGAVTRLRTYLDFLPNLLLNLIVVSYRWMHQENHVDYGHMSFKHQPQSLLSRLSSAIKTQLGGPVIYQGVKFRRPVLGEQHPQPDAYSIPHTLTLMAYCRQISLALFILIYLALIVLTLVQTPA